ncbi:hypothetical protein [Nocardia sp. NPDC004711]
MALNNCPAFRHPHIGMSGCLWAAVDLAVGRACSGRFEPRVMRQKSAFTRRDLAGGCGAQVRALVVQVSGDLQPEQCPEK